jgi:hypothetical protein
VFLNRRKKRKMMNNFENFIDEESLENILTVIPEPVLLERIKLQQVYVKPSQSELVKVQENIVNKRDIQFMNITEKDVELYLKPARKPTNSYVTTFPSKIYCSPYKYDIFVRIKEELDDIYEIKFRFIDSETNEIIKTNNKKKEAILIGKTKTQKNQNQIEHHYRVCFTVCSFHHFKRSFIFQAELKPKNKQNTDKIIFFKSGLFTTFARKNENDVNEWKEEDEVLNEESTENSKKRKYEDELSYENLKKKKTEELSLLLENENQNQDIFYQFNDLI